MAITRSVNEGEGDMLLSNDISLVDKAIGRQIRYWRLSRRLNQAELAQ
jgi:hypothetical protein